MRSRKRQRAQGLTAALLLVGLGTALVLAALEDNLVFFHSPSDIAQKAPQPGQRLRLGGLVETGSVARSGDVVRFAVTDQAKTIAVEYRGILPDLFREGQGVVAEGSLRPDGVFAAATVLAKHDETYMPPEVAEALKKSGRWKHAEGGAEAVTQ